MKAVNLVPVELRGARAPGRSGNAVYVVLGALALAVALVTVLTVLGTRVRDTEARAVAAEAEAQQIEARAANITRYKALAAETSGRVQRVRDLAAGRIDWSGPLTEIAGTIGDEVHFSALTATSAPDAGAAGSSNPLRGALPAPAVEVEGCARDHAAVARLIARFRAMDRVERVSLSDSRTSDETTEGGTGTADSAAGQSGCDAPFARPAMFSVVIFLAPAGTAPATPGTPGAPATAATTATPSTGATG